MNRLAAMMQTIYKANGPGAETPINPTVLVRAAIADLGHGTMTYACRSCGYEWKVWLTLGVEGPACLRDVSLYVPSPFGSGRCHTWVERPDATDEDRRRFQHLERCTGEMAHVRFSEDETFAELRLIPDDAPRFVLSPVHNAAELAVPEAAIIAARKAHQRSS